MNQNINLLRKPLQLILKEWMSEDNIILNTKLIASVGIIIDKNRLSFYIRQTLKCD